MNGNKYTISTISDIFNLPTPEAMERCLNELKTVMVATRAYAELLTGTAKELAKQDGHTIPDSIGWAWPQSLDWTDDGSVKGSEIEYMNPEIAGEPLTSIKIG